MATKYVLGAAIIAAFMASAVPTAPAKAQTEQITPKGKRE